MKSWILSISLHLAIVLAIVLYLYQPTTPSKRVDYHPEVIEASLVYAMPRHEQITPSEQKPIEPKPTPQSSPVVQQNQNQPRQEQQPPQPSTRAQHDHQAILDQRFEAFSKALNAYLQTLHLPHIHSLTIDFLLDHNGAYDIHIDGKLSASNQQAITTWIKTQASLQNLPLAQPIHIHQPVLIQQH